MTDAEQLDLAKERRVVVLAERADNIVRRRQILVAVQLTAGERHEVRRIQPRVLRVDRDEHLNDVVLGKPVEDDGRNREHLVLELVHPGVEREEPMLAVDGAQDPFPLRNFEDAYRRIPGNGLELRGSSHEMMTAPAIDGRSRA